MDLDPDKVANSMSDAAVQAEILKKFQEQNPPPAPAAAPGEAPQAPTGGMPAGGMGTGAAPVPGEQGHSANNGSGNGAGLEASLASGLGGNQ